MSSAPLQQDRVRLLHRRPPRLQTLLRRALRLGLLLGCVALGGCAARGNPEAGTPNERDVVAGFWRGVWHGMIVPVTFVVSLFSAHVGIYEVHNSGAWYDLGFLLGAAVPCRISGAARFAKRRWQRRD